MRMIRFSLSGFRLDMIARDLSAQTRILGIIAVTSQRTLGITDLTCGTSSPIIMLDAKDRWPCVVTILRSLARICRMRFRIGPRPPPLKTFSD